MPRATPAEIGSWMCALVGHGRYVHCLSLRYGVPVVTAWSTPGSDADHQCRRRAYGRGRRSIPRLRGVDHALWFTAGSNAHRPNSAVPRLGHAGRRVLRFGLEVFVAMKTQFAMTLAMFLI